MAEYIDREALLELINEDCKYKKPTNEYTRGCNDVCEWAIRTIENMPTADVVPKSEVEATIDALRHEIASLEKALRNSLPSYCQVMTEKKVMEIGKAYGRQGLAREILSDLKKQIHDKAIYPGAKDTYSFVNVKVFDSVLNNVLMKYMEGDNE